MKYESHPNKKISEHIEEVYQNALFINQKGRFDTEIEIIVKCHDFGKYTTYFQRHLKTKEKVTYSDHAYISAVFGAYVGLEKKLNEEMILLIFSIILFHHGSLKTLDNYLRDEDGFRKRRLEKQLEDIKNNYSEIICDIRKTKFDRYFDGFLNNKNHESTTEQLKRIYNKFKRKNKDVKYYFYHHYLYSILLYADKKSAANIKGNYYFKPKLFNKIENQYRSNYGKPLSKLNKMRSKFCNDVINSVKKNPNKKIYTITAPTGLGKTFAAFLAANYLKDKNEYNRIIYSLPFTTIIDQNFINIKKFILNTEKRISDESKYIIKHHYQTQVKFDSDDNLLLNQKEFLFNTWNSLNIITTFVQLFETIISNRNKMIIKFNRVEKSVVIIDEIQALNPEDYKIIEYFLKIITELFDCVVIIMTATKPYIFNKAYELNKNYNYYFSYFNRTKIQYFKEKIYIDDFIEIINKDKSRQVLVVLNTINEAIKVYNGITSINKYFLSTNLIPKHRKEILEEIRRDLNNNKEIVLVTTQTIEAGVNLDFEIGYRDIAPLGSIIQVAGRINRENKREQKRLLNIYEIYDENNKIFSEFVYNKTLLMITKEILEKNRNIEEKEYKEIIDDYYKVVDDNISKSKVNEIIEDVRDLKFDNFIKDFRLIKNDYSKVDVYLIYDSIEKAYIEYIEYINISNKSFEEISNLKQIKKELEDYKISLPIKYAKKLQNESENYQILEDIFIKKEQIEHFYDKQIGFDRDENDIYIF